MNNKKYIGIVLAATSVLFAHAQQPQTATATSSGVKPGVMMRQEIRQEVRQEMKGGVPMMASSSEMMPAQIMLTGNAEIDSKIKVLLQEEQAKIKAIHDEYMAKIKVIIGDRALVRASSTGKDMPKVMDGRPMNNGTTTSPGKVRGTSTTSMEGMGEGDNVGVGANMNMAPVAKLKAFFRGFFGGAQ